MTTPATTQDFPANAPTGSVFRFTSPGQNLTDYVDYDGASLTSAVKGDIAFRESSQWRRIGVGGHFEELLKAIALADGFPASVLSHIIQKSGEETSIENDDVLAFLDASEDPKKVKRITAETLKGFFLPPDIAALDASASPRASVTVNVPSGHKVRIQYEGYTKDWTSPGYRYLLKAGTRTIDSKNVSGGVARLSGVKLVSNLSGSVTIKLAVVDSDGDEQSGSSHWEYAAVAVQVVPAAFS